MRVFMIALFECSAAMAAVALIYMLLNRLLLKRFSEKWRYYAWLVIIVGLIIPFRPQFGNAAVNITAPDRLAAPVIEYENLSYFNSYFGLTLNPEENVISPGLSGGFADSVKTAEETAGSADKSFDVSAFVLNMLANISWWDITAIIWLIGMTAFIVFHIIKHRKFIRMTKRWSAAADEQALEAFQSLTKEMKIKRRIDLQSCPFAASPMLVGFVEPRILLPETGFAQNELRLILKHELVHYKRNDILYRFLMLIATAMHWFNPVVYLMAKSVDIGCELSCDDEVMRGADLETRRYYGNAILGVVRCQTKLKTLLSTHLNGGKKIVKRRLSSIMDIGRRRGGMIIACIVVFAVLGTGLILAINTNKSSDGNTLKNTETQTDGQGNSVENTTSADWTATDTLVLYRTAYNKWALDPAVSIFKEMYPNVEVEIHDFVGEDEWAGLSEYRTLIETEIPAGKGPDLLLMSNDFMDIYKVMDTDVFCDLNDFIGSDPEFKIGDYNKTVLDSGIYKGKRYLMPLDYATAMLITTEEALAAAEIDPENIKTFDGLMSEIKKYLEKYNSTKLIYDAQPLSGTIFFPWSGMRYIDYENKTVNVDGEDFKKIMDAYKDIYKQDMESERQNTGELDYRDYIVNSLGTGNILFVRNILTSNFVSLYSALLKQGYSPVYFPFPSINGKSATASAHYIASILSVSPNKANAYAFLKILLSEEIQSGVGTIPYNPVLNVGLDIQMKDMKDSWRLSISEETEREYARIATDIDDCQMLMGTTFNEIFSNYMEPYFKGEEKYENCLSKLRNYLELYVSE